ncbi:hypothetical protein [Sinimarinibacterium sp. NLF-5-8]|uniref:hypothetical protein n=1 Tax=Sinimarinibacterium sp. NLF-5-8 TaxID=2698684 RepID=UPI00137BB705|nr:hypothetical protein [Sinimarinibacterium sp. NLF-5-8]QHS11194.1 hypothetical protein GT972_14280 [Sinimarinibacterium sp. NLF-5-8]
MLGSYKGSEISHFTIQGIFIVSISPILWRDSLWFCLYTAICLAIFLARESGRKLIMMPVPAIWLVCTAFLTATLSLGASVFVLMLSFVVMTMMLISDSGSKYWGYQAFKSVEKEQSGACHDSQVAKDVDGDR